MEPQQPQQTQQPLDPQPPLEPTAVPTPSAQPVAPTPKSKKGVIAALVIILFIAVAAAWFFLGKKDAEAPAKNTSASTETTQTGTSDTPAVTTPASNEGYLVMEDWKVRFKIPAGLKSVEYVVNGDTAAFFAKPTTSNVEFRSDYQAYDSASKNFKYALGVVFKSTEASKIRGDADKVEGKKLGSLYYYTNWSFSGLATGAGLKGVFYDVACDKDSTLAKCSTLAEAESKVFDAINQGETSLLNTIELVQ